MRTAPGTSPWAQAQLQNIDQQGAIAEGNAGASAQGAATGAMDTLASRGGLSTGAAANLAKNQAANTVNARQGVQGQIMSGKQGVLSTDAQNQLGVLENLPGQEVQALQPALQEQSLWQAAAGQNAGLDQATNAANQNAALSGLNAKNTFAQTNYTNQLQNQAATQESQAYQNAGKK